MRRLTAGCLALLMLVVGAACGGGTSTSLVDSAESAANAAQRSLSERQAGRIEFAMTAEAEGGDPVGFEIEGEYAFEEAYELAVLDLTYRQVLGERSIETQLVSTGDEAWIVIDGEATELTGEQVAPLRVQESEGADAVPELDLAEWLEDGQVEEKGTKSTVRGEVRASALISDLQDLTAQVAGAGGAELGEATARQIDRSVKSSEMRIESRDGTFRSLSAAVDFGADVPRGLRDALGPYAAARLELSMRVADVSTPLRVNRPE